MPDRIIRESICTSETLNQLTDFEERFWHRLIVNCDDYGRFDARPAILKGRLFPLMDGKTQRNIADALDKLASVGLVDLYEVDGKPFLRVVTWDKYQRIRAKRSKFPEPSEESDDTCCQLTSNVAVMRNAKYEMRNAKCVGEDEEAAPADAEPAVIALPLNDKSEYGITQRQIDEWAQLYPAVDVMQELRKMKGWLDSNPSRRKTKAGILRFITGWLGKEQDRGGSAPRAPRPKGAVQVENSSLNTDEYEQAVRGYVPVYRKKEDNP